MRSLGKQHDTDFPPFVFWFYDLSYEYSRKVRTKEAKWMQWNRTEKNITFFTLCKFKIVTNLKREQWAATRGLPVTHKTFDSARDIIGIFSFTSCGASNTIIRIIYILMRWLPCSCRAFFKFCIDIIIFLWKSLQIILSYGA